MEAQYYAVKSAWFYPNLSVLHKAALQTYDLFKSTCCSQGHTFLFQKDLPKQFKFYSDHQGEKRLEFGQVEAATEFLVEQEVLRQECKEVKETRPVCGRMPVTKYKVW